MASKERIEEVLRGLHDAVVNYDEERTVEWSRTAIEEGIDAYRAVMGGLASAMEEVGMLYEKQEYFVPELLMCSDALYAGLNILRPHIKVEEAQVKEQIVLGVSEGDIHDIGKNLVKAMFDAAGWVVHDLGRDVKLERFAEEQQRTKSKVVGISALMTSSMLGIPQAIKMIREWDPNVIIMVGGAPLTRDIAKAYGADGYAKNAGTAVQEVVSLLGLARKMQK